MSVSELFWLPPVTKRLDSHLPLSIHVCVVSKRYMCILNRGRVAYLSLYSHNCAESDLRLNYPATPTSANYCSYTLLITLEVEQNISTYSIITGHFTGNCFISPTLYKRKTRQRKFRWRKT